MSPIVTSSGSVVIAGKRGTVYLVNHLRGVGSQAATLGGCAAYGGAAGAGQVLFLPCRDGLRRLDASGTTLRWDWQLSGITGSPTKAGRTVYVVDQDSGDLVLVRAATGTVKARFHVGGVTRFVTPVPVGRHLFVGTTSGIVAIRGSA